MDVVQVLGGLITFNVRLALLSFALVSAYQIRLYAVVNYGRVIHEFDPWFNYRAAEYLAANGQRKFFQWFDHTVWYPLGRPVGTTIYPGMQFVAVWIWQALDYFGHPMSLNDVCVFVPAWFGVVATVFLGLLTYEASGSVDGGIAAACLMSILPAHIMRSVAGGFDNECVAISALCSTFYFWCLSLRSANSWPWGVVTGLSYFCMVASWGGYVFVLNVIGLHAVLLVVIGRYSSKLHRAYTLFYVIGTVLAIRIPVVGMTPLRSLEQVGPLGVFFLLQIFNGCEAHRQKLGPKEFEAFRKQALLGGAALGSLVAAVLFQQGYFGPISSRVRGLFVQHTRTGNPLVDSVAEHQATSPRAYWMYLYYTCYLGPIGFFLCFRKITDAKIFLMLYGAVTYYFASKMNRLVLLLGPIASSLGGVAVASLFHWAVDEVKNFSEALVEEPARRPEPAGGRKAAAKAASKAEEPAGERRGAARAAGKAEARPPKKKKAEAATPAQEAWDELVAPLVEAYHEQAFLRKVAAGIFLVGIFYCGTDFYMYCDRLGEAMSQPSIMFKSRLNNGETVTVDDYRESYWWLRDHTPEDARVMAWWDYGYQINGVGNRTTIADGNTWNHEHIATLGRCLTSPEEQAHTLIRHLADYVLVWTGGGGDDLAKSPHMARIANSVYSDVCPGDPACSRFAVDREGNPTEMMAESLLWKLHGHGQREGVQVDPDMFEEAYTSKYNLVRIYKVLNISEESKAWAANPANWKCDAPGSWYCEGAYPPAFSKLIEQRKAFQQLEDFNTKKSVDKEAEEYQKEYHARLSGQRGER
mmetsp:Transcript_28042/g.80461  ORF Transcript_28042/g.80461 Transcript_28042/m.80461 type:complete len:810 (+) Transcript_28042:103-2532(+)